MIKAVLRDFIAADAGIIAQLSTYRFTTGSAKLPAIFTGPTIPADAEYPCVFLFVVGSVAFETRGNKGTTWSVDCSVFSDREMSDEPLWTLSNAIWHRLNRGDIYDALTLQGYQNWGMRADAPRQLNAEYTFPQYLISVRVDCLKV